jgi:hypothetical protein
MVNSRKFPTNSLSKDCQEDISFLFSSKEHFLEMKQLYFTHLFETVQVPNILSFQSIEDIISTLHSLSNLILQFPFLIYAYHSFDVHQETIQSIFDIFSNAYFSCRESTYSFVGSYVLSFVDKFENLGSMQRYHELSFDGWPTIFQDKSDKNRSHHEIGELSDPSFQVLLQIHGIIIQLMSIKKPFRLSLTFFQMNAFHIANPLIHLFVLMFFSLFTNWKIYVQCQDFMSYHLIVGQTFD